MNALKILRSPVIWGLLLMVGGGALLADTLLGWEMGVYFWGTAALLGGLVFLAEYLGKGKAAWWTLIPGVTLLGLAGAMFSGALLPDAAEWLGGVVFLGSIALAFLLVYLADRAQWWAIIPFGVLVTLAVVSVFDEAPLRMGRIDTGSIFFIGLGLTFLLVAILPTKLGKMTWAYIPGGILLVMGLFLLASRTDLLVIVGPAALIIVGLALVVRAFWK